MLNAIAERSAELVGAAYGLVFVSEGDDLVLRAATREFANDIGKRGKKPGTGVLEKVWQSMRPFVTGQYGLMEEDDLFYSHPNLSAVAGVPVIGRNDPLGVLIVARAGNNVQKFAAREVEIFI